MERGSSFLLVSTFVSRSLFPVQDASEKETGTKVGSILPEVSTCDQALSSSAKVRAS